MERAGPSSVSRFTSRPRPRQWLSVRFGNRLLRDNRDVEQFVERLSDYLEREGTAPLASSSYYRPVESEVVEETLALVTRALTQLPPPAAFGPSLPLCILVDDSIQQDIYDPMVEKFNQYCFLLGVESSELRGIIGGRNWDKLAVYAKALADNMKDVESEEILQQPSARSSGDQEIAGYTDKHSISSSSKHARDPVMQPLQYDLPPQNRNRIEQRYDERRDEMDYSRPREYAELREPQRIEVSEGRQERRRLSHQDIYNAIDNCQNKEVLLALADEFMSSIDVDYLLTPPFFRNRVHNEALLRLIVDACRIRPPTDNKQRLMQLTSERGLPADVAACSLFDALQYVSDFDGQQMMELRQAVLTMLDAFCGLRDYNLATKEAIELWLRTEKAVLDLHHTFWKSISDRDQDNIIRMIAHITDNNERSINSIQLCIDGRRREAVDDSREGEANRLEYNIQKDQSGYVRKEEDSWEKEEEERRREEEAARKEQEMRERRMDEERREMKRREMEEAENAMELARMAEKILPPSRVNNQVLHELKKEKDNYVRAYEKSEETEPPCSFRTLADRPVVEDLYKPKQPYIRRAKLEGSYDDAEHYLDVQFRLLREDMVSPLRDGLFIFKQTGSCRNQGRGRSGDISSDLLVLERVSIGGLQVRPQTGEGMRNIQIPMSQLSTLDINKALRFGQIICLSIDRFQKDFHIGLIVERDERNFLTKGLLGVHFFDEGEQKKPSSMEDAATAEDGPNRGRPVLGQSYWLAEPSSYFEAYHHVLKAIKKLRRFSPIPFERYLADRKTDIWKPGFMRTKATTTEEQRKEMAERREGYRVKKEEADKKSEDKQETQSDRKTDKKSAERSQEKKEEEGHWTEEESADEGSNLQHPNENALSRLIHGGKELEVDKLIDDLKASHLDETQRVALAKTLRNELALIQGPPGTGKTHIGVEIVMTILQNRTRWRMTKPILVVTYTNQALDQFLEKLQRKCEEMGGGHPNVIRLGSRSESELLKASHCLRNDAIRHYEDEFGRQGEVGRPARLKKQAAKDLATCARILRGFNNELLSMECIRQVQLPDHSMQMRQFAYKKTDSKGRPLGPDEILACWLLDKDYTDMRETLPGEEKTFLDDGRDFAANSSTSTKKESEKKMAGRETKKEKNERKRQERREREGRWRGDEDFSSEEEELKDIDMEEDDEEEEEDDQNGDRRLAKLLQSMNMRADEVEQREAEVLSCKAEPVYEVNQPWDLEYENGVSTSNARLFGNETKPSESVKGGSKPVAIDSLITRDLSEIKMDILNATPLTTEEANSIVNITELPIFRRWQLYRYWQKRVADVMRYAMPGKMVEYRKACEEMMAALRERDALILSQAMIIGATTTGAAKNRRLLGNIGCPVLVVEEAAEVLEAHLISSMLPSTRQAIFIGDHQQLRPNPAVYELARNYGLEISLFERLVHNGLPYCTLGLQHRMLPLLSRNVVKPFFYKDLEDADSVKEYPSVEGMEKNMFFWCHQQEESAVGYSEETSHWNESEVGMVMDLISYLVLQQQYSREEITVIATYSAQVNRLRQKSIDRFGSRSPAAGRDSQPVVAVETVDSFQGKENKIIILSLVRSKSSSIGFVGVKNRICVALSRAQHGFFVVGNFDFIREKSELWEGISLRLIDKQLIDYHLPIKCTTHGNVQYISTTADFAKKAAYGGCMNECGVALKCTHICKRVCHPPREHDDPCKNRCPEPCVLRCPDCDALCDKKCSMECGDCRNKVTLNLACGHELEIRCFMRKKATCTEPCPAILDCGHKCANKCGESCVESCKKIIEYEYPVCRHVTFIECDKYRRGLIPECAAACPEELACGHMCTAGCGKKCTLLCEEPSERIMQPCGHRQMVACHKDSRKEKCTTLLEVKMPSCGHTIRTQCYNSSDSTKCTAYCSQPTACRHTCARICGECTKDGKHKCDFPCKELLPCGHRCNSGCGQPCGACRAPCRTVCSHMKCGCRPPDKLLVFGRECGQDCVLCTNSCKNVCKHRSCSRKCFEVCNVSACEEPCDLKLDCGHACMGMCKEKCPSLCGTCSMKLYRDTVSEVLGEDALNHGSLHRLLEMPLCGHIFPVTYMDSFVEKLKAERKTLVCPKCKHYADSIRRYERVVKRMVLEKESHTCTRPPTPTQVKAEYEQLRKKIHAAVDAFTPEMRKGAMRIDDIMPALQQIKALINSMQREASELPFWTTVADCSQALAYLMCAFKKCVPRIPILNDKPCPNAVRSLLDTTDGKRVYQALLADKFKSLASALQNSLPYKKAGVLIPVMQPELLWLTLIFHLSRAYCVLVENKTDLSPDQGRKLRNAVNAVLKANICDSPQQKIDVVIHLLNETVYYNKEQFFMPPFFFPFPNF